MARSGIGRPRYDHPAMLNAQFTIGAFRQNFRPRKTCLGALGVVRREGAAEAAAGRSVLPQQQGQEPLILLQAIQAGRQIGRAHV